MRILCVFGHYGSEVLFVTNYDQVFGFGYNRSGCIGIGVFDNNIFKPRLIEELSGKEVINIAYGITHCIALTKNGSTYSWGLNNFGQLGDGSLNNSNKPKLIEGLVGVFVTDICCGSDHTLALTNEGLLYSWGANNFGQIGDKSYSHRLTPYLIPIKRIVSISCGKSHSMVCTENGFVFNWGNNSFGQLGRKQKLDQKSGKQICMNRNIPLIIETIKTCFIEKAVCGQNHSLLLSSDGKLYAFGSNKFGQIGNGLQENEFFPIRINDSNKFKDIISSHYSDFTIAVTVDDKCFIWGQTRDQVIDTPKEIAMQSIHNIFAIHSKFPITYKAIIVDTIFNDHQNESFVSEKIGTNLIGIKDTDSEAKFKANNTLLGCLSKSFNNPSDYDIKFVFKDKFIYAHKTIIRIRNKKFWQRCQTHLNEEVNEIRVKKYSYEIMHAFIEFLYTNSVDIKDENAYDLLILANIYNEEDLKLKCTEIIGNRISIENVCALYSTAIGLKLKELEKYCIEFSALNWKQICKTDAFQEMSESLSKKLIQTSFKP